VTGTALVKTEGLKWNLGTRLLIQDHSMPMNFATLISTSNTFAKDSYDPVTGLFKVVVTTDIPLIFTVERKCL
jgi:hypothetical protein